MSEELTVEELAAGEFMNLFAVYRNKGHNAAIGALADTLRSYGIQCATAERERVVQIITDSANALPADVDDGFYVGYKQAIVTALAAIRKVS